MNVLLILSLLSHVHHHMIFSSFLYDISLRLYLSVMCSLYVFLHHHHTRLFIFYIFILWCKLDVIFIVNRYLADLYSRFDSKIRRIHRHKGSAQAPWTKAHTKATATSTTAEERPPVFVAPKIMWVYLVHKMFRDFFSFT